MGNQNILEVNGKRYDAATGRLLDDNATKAPIHPHPSTGVILDGVSKKTSVVVRSTHTTAHTVHQKSQKSKTLMRTAVKKPAHPTHKSPIAPKAQTSKEHVLLLQQPTQERQVRAEQIKKSSFISKFGSKASTLVTKTSVLNVQPAPARSSEAPETSMLHVHREVPAATSSPFSRAIEEATSHTQPRLKKIRAHHKIAHKLKISPKMLNAGTAVFAVLLLGGFFAYQNVPNFAMRVASTKAGVSGNLPSYHPSGYSLNGPIQFKPGQIIISYRSVSDSRTFSVVQRRSSWNNEALLANYVGTNGPYQSYQDKGRTIYMYGNGNATWLDSGIWYQIQNNASLSVDQVLRLASSF